MLGCLFIIIGPTANRMKKRKDIKPSIMGYKSEIDKPMERILWLRQKRGSKNMLVAEEWLHTCKLL
jgi:hypothetical protein